MSHTSCHTRAPKREQEPGFLTQSKLPKTPLPSPGRPRRLPRDRDHPISTASVRLAAADHPGGPATNVGTRKERRRLEARRGSGRRRWGTLSCGGRLDGSYRCRLAPSLPGWPRSRSVVRDHLLIRVARPQIRPLNYVGMVAECRRGLVATMPERYDSPDPRIESQVAGRGTDGVRYIGGGGVRS